MSDSSHLPHPRHGLTARLNRDWARVVAADSTRRRLATWPLASLARFDDLDALLAATGREGGLPMEAADALLADLVRLAVDGDEVAARVVLQRVVPGLVTITVRRARGNRQALFDDLVGNAWILIRRFPIERRPRKIAVNILRDAEYLTCVRASRLRSAGEVPAEQAALEIAATSATGACDRSGNRSDVAPNAGEELAALLDTAARAGLPPRDVAMVRAVYLDGRRVHEVAEAFAVTPRTVRNRRVALVSRLAALAVTAA